VLNFNESTHNAQILAIYYAKKIDLDLVIDFMESKIDITNTEDALIVARSFWKMVELSIQDNDNDNVIDGVEDIEFWMHKLFNKVSGYLTKNGFEEQWDQADAESKK